MGGSRMDIKQMQYFVSIAQEGSYSRAAEKLSVSQPALSISIKKLEEEFGVKLFYYFDRRQRNCCIFINEQLKI